MENQVVKNFQNEFKISSRKMAKLLDLSVSSIMNWNSGSTHMSSKAKEKITEATQYLRKFTSAQKKQPQSIINLVLAMKEADLWRGWKHIDDIVNTYPTLEYGLIEFVKSFLQKKFGEVTAVPYGPISSAPDYVFKSKNKIIGVEIKTGRPSLSWAGKALVIIDKLEGSFNKPIEVFFFVEAIDKRTLRAFSKISNANIVQVCLKDSKELT